MKMVKYEPKFIVVLAVFGSLTLDFKESKCFFRGTETLVELKEQLQKLLVIYWITG